MTNVDILRLKNDVLNELRNEKYYTQDELKRVSEDQNISHKKKVESVIKVIGDIAMINSKITLVETIFVVDQPQQQPAPVANVDGSEVPDNIVEQQEAPLLNQQGQSHSE